MARYHGPKNRLARREHQDLGLKTPGSHAHAQLLKRLNQSPGQHGQKGRRKISSFGIQLREKQKVKRIYGILEKQFRKYFAAALKFKGNTGEALLQQLEKRLDNILYRLQLSPTRAAARQLVTHGHVLINGQKMSFPAYQTQVSDVVGLTEKGMTIPSTKKLLDDKNLTVPKWLERKGPLGKLIKIPLRNDISEDVNEQLIVEYYSR